MCVSVSSWTAESLSTIAETMPHATRPSQTMDDFLLLHKAQLASSRIPERYWETLFTKMKSEVFDAGENFTILKVEESFSDLDDEEVGETSQSEMEEEADFSWQVVVSAKNGLRCDDQDNIFLIDHAWTYRTDMARTHLETVPGLLQRMTALMDIPSDGKDKDTLVEKVLDEMWRFNQTYNIGNADMGTEDSLPIWYVMDEFGQRVQHSDDPTCNIVPFYYVPNRITYSVLWPIRDLDEGDEVTRNYVMNPEVNGLSKRMMLLPWQPDDMTHLSYEQYEQDDSFFMKYKVHETLPNLEMVFPNLPRDRCVTVYTDVDMIREKLKDPRFEFVDNFDDADVIWTSNYMPDFKGFSEETPSKLINQFPFEMVLTVKDLFAMVARRSGGRIDPDSLETAPAWLQTTYNLNYELTQFVSYFQHREKRDLPNHWICKPYNLARSLDMHVTNNLNYILRLPDTGPKIACRYIDDPVLFEFMDSGMHKFDMRYMVLLHSVDPLKLSVYRGFIVRFAAKPFSADHYDDFQKHFTVMQHKEGVEMKEIDCEDFVDQFQYQYPANPWNVIEESVFDAIRELYTCATCQPSPKGIAKSPQSRAVYGVDVMLKWVEAENGMKKIQPVVLEVNFGPAIQRFCKYRSDFMNDIFGALFLDDFQSGNVVLL